MGHACAKSAPIQGDDANGSSHMTDTEKRAQAFRERRLSMSQIRDPDDPSQNRRRLSVYESEEIEAVEAGGVPEPTSTCACKSVAGAQPCPGGSIGKINQDRALVVYPFNGDDACGLFGVYDGHGKVGEKVSQFVVGKMPKTLLDHSKIKSNPFRALTDAYLEVDDQLDHEPGIDASVSGTTAVTCMMRGNQLWVANAGDSRAVIARRKGKSDRLKAVDLTIDQKPDTPAEMDRIHMMGGRVTPGGANGSPARVWHNLRGLAMARSIGDHNAATVGVIAEPEITEYEITDDDVALIIASDGVWEFITSQAAVDIVANVKSLDPLEICEQIIDLAQHMWKIEEGDYRDDITCVVLVRPWPCPWPHYVKSTASSNGSRGGSRDGSRAGSREGSRPGSRDNSRPTSPRDSKNVSRSASFKK